MDPAHARGPQNVAFILAHGNGQRLGPAAVCADSCIPYELCDDIIDLLCEDRGALCVCCLTCRAWLPRAQYWLYKRVRVHPENKTQFQDALTSNATLGHYVELLSIIAWLPHRPFEWVKFLQSVTPHMPRLMRLEIQSGYFKDPTSFRHLTTIRTLRLKSMYLDSEVTRQAWLRSIPHVEELEFLNVGLTRFSPIAASECSLLPALQSIELSSPRSGASDFMNYVLPDGRRHIKRVYLGIVSPQVNLDPWFQDIAATLEHLAFTNISYDGHRTPIVLRNSALKFALINTIASDFVLDHCIRLRSLEYSINCSDDEKDTACLLWALQAITSPSITALRFNLFVERSHVYDRKLSISDPSTLSRLLLSPKFASLERLSFHLSINDLWIDQGEPPLFADLRTLLPDLNAREILALSTEGRYEGRGQCGPFVAVLEIDEEGRPLMGESPRCPSPRIIRSPSPIVGHDRRPSLTRSPIHRNPSRSRSSCIIPCLNCLRI
ncbi:hypothetical protein CERSUDRAFT_112881 [Gelatoporia subvermispora B]|uniref:F-box domain-containing protein n=1 Tax=Ceriporiopsis subvermispora (strain B) TaxID=914234 RepID=M2RL48_CERS8|nr:hypothetical protein CERSUDRAFT_112881 [Gelatoporia subvermispora B]